MIAINVLKNHENEEDLSGNAIAVLIRDLLQKKDIMKDIKKDIRSFVYVKIIVKIHYQVISLFTIHNIVN